MTSVGDLMTRDVAHVRSNEPLSAAAKLMWDCDCGAVPVLEQTSDRVVGMITDRDICMSTWSRDAAPSAIPISSAMSNQLHYCSPSDDVTAAEALMRSQQIRRLPVLDSSGKLVGIISLADVVRRTPAAGVRARVGDITADEVASTLANICAPPRNESRIQAS
ncbi:MAG TPA: CBS domain-containing protein [Polyangiaceae bacterium]|nr:CBS domain-containing protein [Polyangiaceae bacterium]